MKVKTGNVRTKSVYDPVDPSDGKRILTTQYWARGISKRDVDEYVRKLAPSRELLHAFKRGEIDWDEYKAGYLQELESEDARSEIRRLAELARSQTITVMCICKEETRCHRSLLRDLILQASES